MRKVSKSGVHPIPELMINRPKENLDKLNDTLFPFEIVLSNPKCLNKNVVVRPSIGGNIISYKQKYLKAHLAP